MKKSIKIYDNLCLYFMRMDSDSSTSSPVTPDIARVAEEHKEEANIFFKNQDYAKAIALYSKAIELNPTIAAYYGNRSLAFLKTESFGYALNDASKALELDKSYVKGYYRRAAAHMSLGKFKLALKDFETVTKARPNDKDARTKFNECNKIVKKIAFEKAISIDSKNVADTIDIENMGMVFFPTIEDDYTGPTLEDGKVTQEFMKGLMETYKSQGKLHRKYAYKMLLEVKKLFMTQPSLVDVHIPDEAKFTVCGDIHGQYFDLMNIFELNGNHESHTMNQMYGFEGEVKAKYTAQMAELFTEVYNWLPLAHCLNNRVLVMHGGLFSKDDVLLKDIKEIDRNKQPPEDGLMCELLWSDPQPQRGRAPSKRGVGVQFGPDVTENFLRLNNLDYIIRSHEVKNEGYEVAHGGKCITVFSAPNYCDAMGNKGAFITLNGKDMKPAYTSYDAVPHPNVKPMAYASSIMNMLF
ncbi:hypothetical protein B566_EDAN001070 [Ephemera danica]|nr:hypothetical protein B566_EDAN001070 [Ephemera danica]